MVCGARLDEGSHRWCSRVNSGEEDDVCCSSSWGVNENVLSALCVWIPVIGRSSVHIAVLHERVIYMRACYIANVYEKAWKLT